MHYLVHLMEELIQFLDQHGASVTAIGTVAIAAFTIVLALVTNRQARLTKKAFITTAQAFIFLEDFDPRFATQRSVGRLTALRDFVVKPRWKNSGETPTKDLLIDVNWEIIHGDIPDGFNYPYTANPLRTLIGPKANEWSDPIRVPDEKINAALNDQGRFYIWGRATYRDIFEQKHCTQFCYRVHFDHDTVGNIQTQFIAYGDYNHAN